jgi:hypothetical protein
MGDRRCPHPVTPGDFVSQGEVGDSCSGRKLLEERITAKTQVVSLAVCLPIVMGSCAESRAERRRGTIGEFEARDQKLSK